MAEFVKPLVLNLKLTKEETKIFCVEHENYGPTNITEVHFVLSCLHKVIVDKLLSYYDQLTFDKPFTVIQRKYIAVLVKEKIFFFHFKFDFDFFHFHFDFNFDFLISISIFFLFF